MQIRVISCLDFSKWLKSSARTAICAGWAKPCLVNPLCPPGWKWSGAPAVLTEDRKSTLLWNLLWLDTRPELCNKTAAGLFVKAGSRGMHSHCCRQIAALAWNVLFTYLRACFPKNMFFRLFVENTTQIMCLNHCDMILNPNCSWFAVSRCVGSIVNEQPNP